MNVSARLRQIVSTGRTTEYVVEVAAGSDWTPVGSPTAFYEVAVESLREVAAFEMRQLFVTASGAAKTNILAIVA